MSTTVKLIYNAIFGGKWISAGTPIEESILPPSLRKYIAPEEEQSGDDDEINLARKYGQAYSVDSQGRMGRPVKRQIAQMQIEAERPDALEEEVADTPIDPTVAKALAEAQEDYAADVQKQIHNARIAADNADDVKDAVREEQDERVESGEFDEFDVDERKPKPKPLKRKSYVKRGSRYVLASTVELILGERLYFVRKKQFGIDARYVAFGKVKRKESK